MPLGGQPHVVGRHILLRPLAQRNHEVPFPRALLLPQLALVLLASFYVHKTATKNQTSAPKVSARQTPPNETIFLVTSCLSGSDR